MVFASLAAAQPQTKQALEQLETASSSLATQNDVVLEIVARYHMAKVLLAAGDTRKAKEALEFATASLRPDLGAVEARHQFLQFQSQVVSTAVSVDPEHGMEMIHAMPAEMRIGPAWQLIQYYQKGNLDKAVETARQFCLEGICPYPGVRSVMKALAPDDDRRVQLYYNAVQAYRTSPDEGFIGFFKEVWPEIPKAVATQGLDLILGVLLNLKEEHEFQQVYSSAAGTAILNSRVDAGLFKLIPAMRALEPKRLEEILDQRMGLRSAVTRFSDGFETLEKAGSVDYSIGAGGGGGGAAIAREASHSALAKAMADVEKNPDGALEAASAIADPTDRIRLLSAVAQRGGGGPLRGPLLGRCLDLAKDLPPSTELVDAMLAVAKSGKAIQDDAVVRAGLDRALATARGLRKLDGDPDRPNLALIEYWPSAQAYRKTVVTAIALQGPDGLWVLARIPDADVAILARIAAAEALIGNPPSGSVTYWTFRR